MDTSVRKRVTFCDDEESFPNDDQNWTTRDDFKDNIFTTRCLKKATHCSKRKTMNDPELLQNKKKGLQGQSTNHQHALSSRSKEENHLERSVGNFERRSSVKSLKRKLFSRPEEPCKKTRFYRTNSDDIQRMESLNDTMDLQLNIANLDRRIRRQSLPTTEPQRSRMVVDHHEYHTLQQVDNSDTQSLFGDLCKQKRYEEFVGIDSKYSCNGPASIHGYSTLSLHSLNTDTSTEIKLIEENESLKSELQDMRDQMELLEFRILEFTDGDAQCPLSLMSTASSVIECHENDDSRSTNSTPHILGSHRMLSSCEESSGRTSIEYFSRTSDKQAMEACDNVKIVDSNTHSVTDDINALVSTLELTILNSDNPDIHKTINKLRSIAESSVRMDEQFHNLNKENKSLQESITTLSDSHETRTEASGTESEIVHGKSPLSTSDISDTESDIQPHKTNTIETATSFQESGIFDASQDFLEVSTQTSEMTAPANTEIQLQEALQRLSVLQATLQENDMYQSKESRNQMHGHHTNEDAITDVVSHEEYTELLNKQNSLCSQLATYKEANSQLEKEVTLLKDKLKEIESRTLSEETEVMKGAVRALKKQLESSEKYKEKFFEEKCEYEEAENDARLMVQRLEGQLEAAQEMESLLSASLAQEQEFSRHLQRRLRDFQDFEQETRMREGELMKKLDQAQCNQSTLIQNYNTIYTQYAVHIFCMLMATYTQYSTCSSRALIPYSSDANRNMSWSGFPNIYSYFQQMFSKRCSKCRISLNAIEKDEDIQEPEIMDYLESAQSVGSTIYREEVLQSNALTDREKYYLQQIELLQHEKKSLRQDYEASQADDLYQEIKLKDELTAMNEALQSMEDEKCRLLLKLQETECFLSEVDSKHNQRYDHLKSEYTQFIDGLRKEHNTLAVQFEKRMQELRNNCNLKEQTLSKLLEQQTNIQIELAPYVQQMSCTDSFHEDSSESYGTDRRNLVEVVRNLVKNFQSVRDNNYELREKESAYMETINEADKIMASHVNEYNKHIEQLEDALKQRNDSLLQIEDCIKVFKDVVYQDYGQNPQCIQLLDDLMDKYESALAPLTSSPNSRASPLVNKMSVSQEIKDSEFWEKKEILQKLMKLTSENNSLRIDLQHGKDSSRRLNELQQTVSCLNGRIEELEMSESFLNQERQNLEQKLAQKEKLLQDKTKNLSEEISSLKSHLELTESECNHLKSLENSHKSEIEMLKQEIQILQTELKENTDDNANSQSQHRSEVGKLRSHLKLVNSHLSDIGMINGELREKLSTSEKKIEQAAQQLRDQCKKHENDIVSLNLRLSQKDGRIEELEAQLQQANHATAAKELDFFFTSPLSAVNDSLSKIIDGIQECDHCKHVMESDIKSLMDAKSSVASAVNGKLTIDDLSQESSEKESWSTDGIGLSEDNTAESCCESPTHRPAAPPRPRRDAKRKKKVKKSTKNENSLLYELNESARRDDKHWSFSKESLAVLNDLKNKVVELEDAICQKESEIKLADAEATQLHSQLVKSDSLISEKADEIEDLKITLGALRGELLKAVEEHEKTKHKYETKNKDDHERFQKEMLEMKISLENVSSRIQEKNKLLDILLSYVTSTFRYVDEPQEVMNRLRQNLELPDLPDHTIDSIQYRLLQSIQNTKERLHQSTQTQTISFVSNHIDIVPEKSQINHANPQRKPRDVQSTPEDPHNDRLELTKNVELGTFTRSKIPRFLFFSKMLKKHNSKSTKMDPPTNSKTSKNPSRFATFSRASSKSIRKTLNFDRTFKSLPSRTQLERDTKVPPTDQLQNCSSKSYASATISSVKKERISHSTYSPSPVTDVPRPQNLKITRRVGIDGVVIAWDPVESSVAGFQVVVDGRVVQQVRSPRRTKALVNGLPFPDGFTIGLVSVALDGRCSVPAIVSYERSSAYKFPQYRKNTKWGNDQKCIPAIF